MLTEEAATQAYIDKALVPMIKYLASTNLTKDGRPNGVWVQIPQHLSDLWPFFFSFVCVCVCVCARAHVCQGGGAWGFGFGGGGFPPLLFSSPYE
jgi:hypothetical protein